MNDFDLDSKLKALRVPERGEDYWGTFPARVLAKSRATPVERVQRAWLPHLAWGSSIALACLVAGFWLGSSAGHPQKTVCYALIKNLKSFHAELAQFPERVRTVMQMEHGMHSLIEDQP
jgi:hypothetical protein